MVSWWPVAGWEAALDQSSPEGVRTADQPTPRNPAAAGTRDAADIGEETRQRDFAEYMARVAQARYVMRKVLRILTDAAKKHGMDGMEHQALVQIAGTPDGQIPIHLLADRLDIVPAFASRLVKQLEARKLIERSSDATDRRVTLTSISEAGLQLLQLIDDDVHYQMAHFQRSLQPHDRAAAMAIFAFYVGESPDSAVAVAIRSMLDVG
jgi:DNA-binding MarR family transcriptional regulator